MDQRVLNVVPEPRTHLETYRDEQPIEIRTVLQELYFLLESYAPVWYTQEHHDRAVRALLQRDS